MKSFMGLVFLSCRFNKKYNVKIYCIDVIYLHTINLLLFNELWCQSLKDKNTEIVWHRKSVHVTYLQRLYCLVYTAFHQYQSVSLSYHCLFYPECLSGNLGLPAVIRLHGIHGAVSSQHCWVTLAAVSMSTVGRGKYAVKSEF